MQKYYIRLKIIHQKTFRIMSAILPGGIFAFSKFIV